MKFLAILLSIASLATACPAGASTPQQGLLSEEQAREEVELVANAILERHPNPFWQVDRNEWDARLTELIARSGPIDHVTHYFDLFSLMALAHDTHTQIYPEADTPGFETSYPLRFRLFAEGVYITAADGPYRDWVGWKVTAINGHNMEEVIATLTRFAASDHLIRKRSWGVEILLPHPATYAYLGWRKDDRTVALTVETLEGEQQTVYLRKTIQQSFDAVARSGTSSGYYWPEGWRTLNDLIPSEPPLSRRHLNQNYWFTTLEDGKVAYVQINRPFDQEGRETLLQFTLDTYSQILERQATIERIIVDVRHNLGGSISYTLPFPYLTQAFDLCCEPGSVVVLSGRESVSAGSIMVAGFERATRPVVIGEPTGSAPNIFYRHEQIELPHSGLYAEASTDRYVATVNDDYRVYSAPDIEVAESIHDVLAGRDRALEAALALTNDQAEQFYTRGRAYRAWIRPSQDNVPRGRPPGS